MGDPDVSGAAEVPARRVGRVRRRRRITVIRDAGWKEAGFLLDWSQRAAVAGDVVEDVTNGVVTTNAVPSTKAGEGVVTPPVLGLPAEWGD